ncbi:PREDICTED: brain-specific angiogenesis inhibitor 1-associated protein 2-like protein 2 [Myotis brandtii]|uniref:brain-specific angiogenesis inhibitor 1-associated protein 2-like protein 2 n=1 Tax=Myotis brandtii TaxID=109478 RepID=UPI0007044AE4|nr:PREDICTED: brain-specific angiogenesis inhibitor 1-associated protein 2-like protein 2 [Myotis brandtii]
MAPEMDQFYRSTMAIYKSILEQFNPALENLVYLGNNYLRAFHALSEAAEVYFSAIQKIGEQALQSSTSQILGEILVQMSDTQRHLNSDLEVVVQTFHGDLLQHMEKNTKLDMQFIKDSRQHYEIEYRHRAANLEKCMSELWRMERKRDKNVREMKESVNRLHAQMQTFVSESQRAAELEEKRRYRFLAEKHLLLSNTFLQFFGRARGTLQNRVLLWKEQSEASRQAPLGRRTVPASLGPHGGCSGTLCFPSRSGWFPEAYVKPLEEVPVNPMNALNPVTSMNPMNALNPMTSMSPMNPLNPVTSMNPMSPMNELPSRSYPLRGSHSLDDLLDRPGNATAPSEYWDGQPRSRTRVPSRAPSPAPTPLPGSRRGSMGSTGVASDIKKLMSWEQQPPELFPRGTNPFATVKLRPTVTNDRSAPLIR